LERRVGDRTFNSGGPPVDENGLPDWTGDGLSVEAYSRILGDLPDEELTPPELETRHRLAPFAELFQRLDETGKAEVEP
jgi:hypothetical protein